MKKKFEISQRVAVYAHYGRYVGVIVGIDMSISTPFGSVSGMLKIQAPQGTCWYHHPKQCRHLKPKTLETETRRLTLLPNEIVVDKNELMNAFKAALTPNDFFMHLNKK